MIKIYIKFLLKNVTKKKKPDTKTNYNVIKN